MFLDPTTSRAEPNVGVQPQVSCSCRHLRIPLPTRAPACADWHSRPAQPSLRGLKWWRLTKVHA